MGTNPRERGGAPAKKATELEDSSRSWKTAHIVGRRGPPMGRWGGAPHVSECDAKGPHAEGGRSPNETVRRGGAHSEKGRSTQRKGEREGEEPSTVGSSHARLSDTCAAPAPTLLWAPHLFYLLLLSRSSHLTVGLLPFALLRE